MTKVVEAASRRLDFEQSHPTAWLIQLDGMIVDARNLPVAVQEEAFRRGLIPFMP